MFSAVSSFLCFQIAVASTVLPQVAAFQAAVPANRVSPAQRGVLRALPDESSSSSSSSSTLDRRSLLQTLGLSATTVLATTSLVPQVANAAEPDNRLFSTNPLTNPVLEQLRIWDQAVADNIKYDGELERGDAGNRGKVSAYPALLVPILQIAQGLSQVQTLVQTADTTAWSRANEILSLPYFEKKEFKRLFNAFGDNIYFADPDRANLYLGGGATPKSEQSMAYLLRNDILTHVEELQAEVQYLIKHPEETDEDLRLYAKQAVTAMQAYLELVSPAEIKEAQSLMQKQQS